MKNKWMATVGVGGLLTAGIMPAWSSVVIDDFGGGPDTVSLVSLAPPQLVLGSFFYGGAVGGVRDVVAGSSTRGSYAAGVAFGSGGFASFAGTGYGALVYDGVPGISDANADGTITVDELDYGLLLDIVNGCPDPRLRLNAFTDLPGSSVGILLATSATDWASYTISLTTVGAFADYDVSVFAPAATMGAFDPTDVGAIILSFDGGALPNNDILVSSFEVTCVPEPNSWMAVGGFLALFGAGWARYRR